MSSRPCEFVDREFITVLLVSALIEDHLSLRSLIGHSNWGLHHAFSREDAVGFLKRCPTPVVICDCDLPDGTWRDLWREIDQLPSRPRLIVSSRVADERLWGEVLNLRVFDLLAKPFEPSEVLRAGFLAWHSWRNGHGSECKPPVVPEARNAVHQMSFSAVPG